MLSKTAVHRLSMLADYMEKQPAEHFDMGTWLYHPSVDNKRHKHRFKEDQTLSESQVHTCKTVACALGHAAVSPMGEVLGLSLVVESVDTDGSVEGGVYLFGESVGELEAATRAFDISHADANNLFLYMHAKTPQQWARKCRAYIKANS